METELLEWTTSTKNTKELSEKVIRKVEEKLAELDRREQKWNKMMEQLEANSSKLNSKVILDVGGKRFAISKDTLLQSDSYFSAMLQSGQFAPGADGAYFIDRSPKYFAIILDYIRNGKLSIKHLTNEQYEDFRVEVDYYQIKFCYNGTILSNKQVYQIEAWTKKYFGELLWQGSVHGFAPGEFHTRCDNKGPTIVIVKCESGFIFGGYAAASWDSSGTFTKSKNSFIFTLKNPHKIEPTKFMGDYLYCATTHGPSFSDLLTYDKTASFKFSTYKDTTGIGPNLFTGTATCTIADIEVLEMK